MDAGQPDHPAHDEHESPQHDEGGPKPQPVWRGAEALSKAI